MRKALIACLTLAVAALAVAAAAPSATSTAAALPGCAKDSLNLLQDGKLTIGRQPGLPAVVRRHASKGSTWKMTNPTPARATSRPSPIGGEATRLWRSAVQWTGPFHKSYAPGKKPFDFYLAQVSYLPVRAKTADFSSSYYYANQAVVGLKKNAISKVKTMAGLKPFQFGAHSARRATTTIVKYIKPNKTPTGVRREHRRRRRPQEQADRRARRRLPDTRLHHRSPGAGGTRDRPLPPAGHEGVLRRWSCRRATRLSAASTRCSPACGRTERSSGSSEIWLAGRRPAPEVARH